MSIGTPACAGTRGHLAVEPGDVVLSRAHGRYKHRIIERIQGTRLLPEHRAYAGYTHAALVVSTGGDLLEAYGDGLHRSHLDDLVGHPHQVVHIAATPEARQRALAVALHAFDHNARYDRMATVTAALAAVSGSRLVLPRDGAYTCSGFVAYALLAVGAVYDVDPANVTPAQLAIRFGAPAPPYEPLASRRLPHGARRDPRTAQSA